MTSPEHKAGRAAHTITLTGELPEWVQLLPAGIFLGRDGRGPYQVPNPEEVIRLTLEKVGADLPIDYGHALERDGHAGDSAPAAGWISQLESREGEIWGRVTWTGSGEVAIRGREFRFLSPVFYHAADGSVLWILRAGLTNRPNLNLRSINSKQTGDDAGEEIPVAADKNTLGPVATALGLPETADETAVLARCSQVSQAQAGLSKVAQSLSLAATASADDVIQAINSRSTPDLTQYVPRAQYDGVASELRAVQAKEGERLVDAATAEGRLAPALRDWALSLHTKDPKQLETFLANQPITVAPGAEDRAAHSEQGRAVDEQAKAICASLGISTDDFIKNKES